MTSSARPLELWFDFGSNYSYLTVLRIEDAAARHGVTVAWRPFLLGPIFRAFGWETSPFVLQKAKGAYVWVDMVRRCRKYGLAWTKPTTFPRAAVLPSRVALLGAHEPWIGEFCRRVMTQNFVDDRDIDTAETIGPVLDAMGLPAQALLAQAVAPEAKQALRDQTDAARSLGIFGAPTLIVDGELYWGDDRLEDALARCVELAR